MPARKLRLALAITTGLCSPVLFASAAAQNLPVGPSVGAQSGGDTVAYSTAGTTGTLNLGTNERTIVNWSSFDVSNGYTMQFQYGGTGHGAVLNRVVGGTPSEVYGNLLSPSNLSVFLINPNGILFGSGASVNVGGLVASSLDLADADFMDGNSVYNFTGVGTTAVSVLPGANVQTGSGPLVLLGGSVSNGGALAGGDVVMAAASDVTMAFGAGSPMSMTISQGTPVSGGLIAGGTINGRNVYLAVATRTGVFDALLNVNGTVTATSATATDRGVVLAAGTSASGITVASGGGNDTGGPGRVDVSGILTANAAAGAPGGVAGVEVRARGNVTGSGAINAADFVQISSALGNVALTGSDAIDAGDGITVSAAGTIQLTDADTADGNLVATGSSITLNSSALNATSGNVLLTGATTVSGASTVSAGGPGGAVTFNNSIDGAGTLTVSASGDTLFNGNVGSTTALNNLSVNAARVDVGTVLTTNAVSVTAAFIGSGSRNLDLSAGGNISLTGQAAGLDVALNSGGAVTAGDIVSRDDIVIRAAGPAATGTLTSGATVDALAPVDVFGPADALAGAALAGADVDIRSSGLALSGVQAGAAGADVRLDATAGAITASGVIRGDAVSLTAGSGIGTSGARINTAANTVTASSGAGAVYISEVDAVAVSGSATTRFDVTAGASITAPAAISVASGDIVLTANGAGSDITVSANITAGGGGDIRLTAADMLNANGFAALVAQDIFLSAGDWGGGSLASTFLQETQDLYITDTQTALFTPNSLSAARDLYITVTGTDLFVPGASALAAGGNITLSAARDLVLQGTVDATGDQLHVAAGGLINQTAGSIRAGTLTGSAGGAASLSMVANQITNLGAFSANGLSLADSGGLAITGAVAGGSGNTTIGTLGGDLTIASTGSISGSEVVLSTDQDFVNNSGSDAISASSRWVVYSAAPASNVYGGLDSGNAAIWNASLATRNPSTISGNRYVFAFQPTLTVTGLDVNKVYGTDLSGSTGGLYSVTGYHPGVTGAFLGDTAATAYSGAPLVSSPGLAADASVAGGPYAVSLSAGTMTSSSGYALAFGGSGSITVTPKAITGTVVADDKTYDGTTGATGVITLEGILSGDDVTASALLAFADRNAGSDRLVTISGGSLGGADAGNYTLTLPGSVVADIFQKAITGTVVADDKTYDGTTGATGTITLDGVVLGDDVSASVILAFLDKNAGADKTVTITGAGLTGADAGNYTLTLPTSVLADIFQKAITGTVVADDKTYDGTTGATGTVTLGGVVAGDEVSASAILAFLDKNAGADKTVTISGGVLTGADAGNYTVTLPTSVLADIFQKAITGSVIVDDKTYDATTGATGTITLDGVVVGDEVSASAILAFLDKNAGTDKTVTISGGSLSGADAGNYTLALPATAFADIFQKAITGTVIVGDKTYDGTTTATGTVALDGVLAGDEVTASALLAFADKNAGSDKTVTISGGALSGADAGNYTLTLPASTLADIFQKAITGTVVADDKTYDGTTTASGGITLDGLISGDNVTASAILTFVDANSGSDRTVTVSGGSLGGADAGNYSLTLPASTLADIFRRAITVTANPATKDQGEIDPALTYSITDGSLVQGESLSGALAREPGEQPGAYDIQQGTLAASSNYDLTFVGSTLTINPRIVLSQDVRGLLLATTLGAEPSDSPLIFVDDGGSCDDKGASDRQACQAMSARR